MTKPMLPILIQIFFGISLAKPVEIPKGWKLPEASSFDGAWRKASPSRYLASGTDINCDGLIDSILILRPTKGLGIGVFVFLNDGDEIYTYRQLFDSRKDAELKGVPEKERKKVQYRYSSVYGIKFIEKGIYPTACGQGYRICGKNEKRKVEMACGGIDFFPIDQGSNINFYWDPGKKRFSSAVMSD